MTAKTEQTDIFSMFGIVDEYEEKKRKEEEERKKREQKMEEIRKKAGQSNTKVTNQKKKEEEFKVDRETVIRYFGETIPIQNYFTEEEISEGVLKKKKDGEERIKIDAEMLRKRMEKDYPELIKGMTEMVYIEKKNLVVPVIKAKKKGNCMVAPTVKGLTDPDFKIKVPFSVLRDFIAIAKLYAEACNRAPYEVHGDIYISLSTGEYFLDIPRQKISTLWCEVIEEESSILERLGMDVVKVMEIHSHHYMRPLPSARDNLSEIVPGMYYCIIGSLQKPFPEITIRRRRETGWDTIPFNEVFEDPFETVPQYLDISVVEHVIDSDSELTDI